MKFYIHNYSFPGLGHDVINNQEDMSTNIISPFSLQIFAQDTLFCGARNLNKIS